MRFSEIVGQGFFGIILTQDEYFALDCHYTGSAHHYLRWQEATAQDSPYVSFHWQLHRAHLRHLMEIVFHQGNFNHADDPSYSGLDSREAWDPSKVSIP